MCLGIPMRIKRIDGFTALCEARGVEREAGLLFMQDEALAVGDHVVISLGQVIQKISAEEAETAWQLYDQMLGSP
jgi:hydrogenase expression/formation protein HypC